MNALAFITAVGLACTVIAVGVAIAAFVVEPRRRRATSDDAGEPEPQIRPEPTDVWIELAEQRRALDELRGEVEQLRRQPG